MELHEENAKIDPQAIKKKQAQAYTFKNKLDTRHEKKLEKYYFDTHFLHCSKLHL